METQIIWGWNDAPIDAFQVSLEWERQHQKLSATEAEFEACPDSFRCICCLRSRTKKHFAGLILEQRVCDFCEPFVDSSDIRAIVRFDKWHGFLPVKVNDTETGEPVKLRNYFLRDGSRNEVLDGINLNSELEITEARRIGDIQAIRNEEIRKLEDLYHARK